MTSEALLSLCLLVLCRCCSLAGGVDGEGEEEDGRVGENEVVDEVEDEEEDVRMKGYGLGDRLLASTALFWELASMAPALTSTPSNGATGWLQIFSHHSSNMRCTSRCNVGSAVL